MKLGRTSRSHLGQLAGHSNAVGNSSSRDKAGTNRAEQIIAHVNNSAEEGVKDEFID